jgi:uncharacterized protein YjiS (DUF1127 family)
MKGNCKMASVDNIQNHGAGFVQTGLFGSVVQWFKSQRLRSKAYRATFKELSNLTDRELHDIGITRGMIHTLAKEEAARF